MAVPETAAGLERGCQSSRGIAEIEPGPFSASVFRVNSKSCGLMHAKLWRSTLELIAADEVANRPGRIKPRVLQRRRHRYPLMQRPRRQLRRQPATALSGW
jgi:hypothetical protein